MGSERVNRESEPFEPSEAMVEAGARALFEAIHSGMTWEEAIGHEPRHYRFCAEIILVAACTATVRAHDGCDLPDEAHEPVWAWLSPFLNAGMLEPDGYISVPDVFRVLPPATPGEDE